MFEVIFIGCSKPWIHMDLSATHATSIRGISPSIDVIFKGYEVQQMRLLDVAQNGTAEAVFA